MVSSDPVERIQDAAAAGRLAIVIGAGISIGLTGGKAGSWPSLIKNGLDFGSQRGLLTPNQYNLYRELCASADVDDLITSAEFVTRKLGGINSDIYARWLEDSLGGLQPSSGKLSNAIKALHTAGLPIATLNYDTLIEQVTGDQTIDFSDIRSVTKWTSREANGIFHIHGSWLRPATCVFGSISYNDTVRDEHRALVQRSIASFNTLLFLGVGGSFADPNFSALRMWMRSNVGAAAPQHYALTSAADVTQRLMDPDWLGFVEPISYGDDHHALPEFLEKVAHGINSRKSSKSQVPKVRRRNTDEVIRAYQEFILKDCGQMTIEGVRADMETAKQRFDLERLFVPLEFDPEPPTEHFSEGGEEHLARWRAANPARQPFGAVLEKSKRIALLALPGGGKTLLLKRLAVAYVDENRRRSSDDQLPDLSVLPVLIRCREWKNYIHLPFMSLLKSLPEITGLDSLLGFDQAVIPYLQNGRVLLLVDGLDEIHDDGARTLFVDNLERLLDTHKAIRLLITSREAGFDLVAPTLHRFCDVWKIAPLPERAIRQLSTYWHVLMNGENEDSQRQALETANLLLTNGALQRLAENPLLLTMLLVVKHGAGRFPPDRAGLYDRAIEVLLDTWNVKGHDALNIREAVPQLACLAYELLKQGKQSFTEQEMVEILDLARDCVPQIRRYAKDEPSQFIKRVELRSSLILQSGYVKKGFDTVRLYQFRHLTFQEYLAAIAVVQGHYLRYIKDDTVLSPLTDVLLLDEWKEVTPMVAVLAKKQAVPLLEALTTNAVSELATQEGAVKSGSVTSLRPIASIRCLTQAFIEEAEFPPDLLHGAYTVVAMQLFHGERASSTRIASLARGPYGEDIRDYAWRLYQDTIYREPFGLRNSSALLEHFFSMEKAGTDDQYEAIVVGRLGDADAEVVGRASMLVAGDIYDRRSRSPLFSRKVYNSICQVLERDDQQAWEGAAWSFALMRYIRLEDKQSQWPSCSKKAMDKLAKQYLADLSASRGSVFDFAVETLASVPRGKWSPTLCASDLAILQETLDRFNSDDAHFQHDGAPIVIAFHLGSVLPDETLVPMIHRVQERAGASVELLDPILKEIDPMFGYGED